jgi:hypothetical protein
VSPIGRVVRVVFDSIAATVLEKGRPKGLPTPRKNNFFFRDEILLKGQVVYRPTA